MVDSTECINIIKQMRIKITTNSAVETEKFAEELAGRLRGGEVIELISDLGGGKTTFVRGLARGLGSQDRVASPTFTISKVYQGTNLRLYHFDFYRLSEAGLIEHELQEILNEEDVVTVIEWGKIVTDVLPEDRLTVRLTKSGEEKRDIECVAPDRLVYMDKDVA